ncbi:MAG: hypothetical protein R6U27_16800 [Desulfobacterales bacterium]
MATDIQLTIPMPLQVMVDDVGWWSGKDGSQINQPFRTGMSRNHFSEDYAALARLGKKLKMKILAGFVICEWDKFDILRKLPSATWMGTQWSMAGNRLEEKEKAAWIIKNAKENIEIGLHGVGHEFWINKRMNRAEFHNEHCEMRDRDVIRRHLEYFFKLMDQYKLAPMPSCFIPPALKHSFGNGDEGFQKLLNEFAIRYVATRFKKARQFSKPIHPKITWESGVMLVDREKAVPAWNEMACDPAFSFDGPILTLHWPNLLHHDPGKNLQVVDRWVQFIKRGAEKKNFIFAPDIKTCLTQYFYKMFSKIKKAHKGFVIDLSWRKNIPPNILGNSFWLRINKSSSIELQIFGAQPAVTQKKQQTLLLEMTPENGAKEIMLSCNDREDHFWS